MNNKLIFLEEVKEKIDGFKVLNQRQGLYSNISKDLEEHYKIKNRISSLWNHIVTFPEFIILEDAPNIHIRSRSEGITICTLDNKEIAQNICDLMNLSYREGAKRLITMLKEIT